MHVDHVNAVIVWCVTGPLNPRSKEHKDIGFYSAQAYEGVVTASNKELKIGIALLVSAAPLYAAMAP